MDWIEQHNPMHVDWKAKWMSFDYQGGTTMLQGILPTPQSCSVITSSDLAKLDNQDQI
jgi:hypothetical protein